MTHGNTGGCCGGACETPGAARKEAATQTFQPRADVSGTESQVIARLDVPGATADTIDIDLHEGVLTVRAGVAPREADGARWQRREYGVGSFERKFRLGEAVDASAISAECVSGVLTIRVPRAKETGPTRIAVNPPSALA